MKSSKCTDRPGVSHSGISDQCSRGEAGRQSSFLLKSAHNTPAFVTGPAKFSRSPGRLLRFVCLAVIAVALVLSSPFSALCQLSPALKEGLDYHKAGKLREAIDVYSEAVEKDPKSEEAYNWRGMAYEDLGELNKALADFNKALEISNNYADAYNNRGEVYRKQNKLVEAMSDYRRAAEMEKTFAEPHYNMAVILEAQKKNDQAIREFEAYLKLKPDAPDKQQIAQKIEELKKTIAAAPPAVPAPGAAPSRPGVAPTAPAPAPPGVAPGAPQPPGQTAPKPPETKPGEAPALPKPGGPRPGAVQIKPPVTPPGLDLGIPGVPPIPIPPDLQQALSQASQGFDVVSVIISVLFYLFPCAMIFLIARKTNTSLPWLAFVPIAQIFLLLNIARKPVWWFLLFLTPILLIPLVLLSPFDPTGGIVVAILAVICWVGVPFIVWLLICTGMARERGKSAIWGILTWFPCTSPLGLAYLGLSK
jgi:tetratricopeptide (TPR) repeat protein